MAYLLRKNLYSVELIEYHNEPKPRAPYMDDPAFSNHSILEDLNIDEEGRDYTQQNNDRAYWKILEYGTCNLWNYFVTFTFSPKNFDRADSDKIMKSILIFFNHYQQRYDSNLRYILVPEPHPTSGYIHLHGLFCLSNPSALDLNFMYKDKYTHCKVYKSNVLLDKFGRNQFINIVESSEACTYYISKYIKKSDSKILSHRYYCSQGLAGYEKVKSVDAPELLAKIDHFLDESNISPCFQNSFIKKYSFPRSVTFDVILSGDGLDPFTAREYEKKRRARYYRSLLRDGELRTTLFLNFLKKNS